MTDLEEEARDAYYEECGEAVRKGEDPDGMAWDEAHNRVARAMTNGEKYKGAKERAEAYLKWIKDQYCMVKCATSNICAAQVFEWLDLDAPAETPLPCPFCGGEMKRNFAPESWVSCSKCFYQSKEYNSIEDAIAAHNRVARAVMAAKEAAK